jgi:hypothetical protein
MNGVTHTRTHTHTHSQVTQILNKKPSVIQKTKKTNSVASVRLLTIPIEGPPLFGDVSANF